MSAEVKAKVDSKDSKKQKTQGWLVLYNQASASLWSIVLFNTIFLSLFLGQPLLFEKTNRITTVIQTLALVEVYNSAVGIVKSPILTTLSQVSSRLLVVYGIFQILPNSPANSHWSYITLSLSWSITEIIRYLYYAQNISTNGKPAKILTLLRYNLFFILYPSGVASEISMIILSLNEAKLVVGAWYKWLLIIIIGVYVPGFYTLFTHMLKQRKRALRSLNEKKEN
ncbi:putative membrane protein [Wickerhamomyces ciferrii]|uniref:Very-long-chain (3R)-3-hydroxyacyl-CoA dehydratase n=1 Tax=Wickerhamomyces ciferrii (strain ATCC 14091 / BCRC 22168 / CBS 111 / JCM 3599 / NBRC 0793 / NRRL Y-1031 F-60-10) TaxID=1206466 RepID=K0KWN4_WICCF|nr:uncharacterized protein BN7_6031 [Wickerhamomyces ciferrii]CCH46437.1 putative membrane protein [Wickerhamomyces ciferrii]